MTLLELTAYYSSLLAYQYRNQAKAVLQMKLWTKQAVADFFAAQLLTCYNIDTAVGTQLDVLGKYVGVPRNLGIIFQKPYFTFWTYSSALDPAKYEGTWNPATNSPPLPAPGVGNFEHWFVVGNSGVAASPYTDAVALTAGDILFSDGFDWVKYSGGDSGNGFTTYADPLINSEPFFYSYAFASNPNSALTDAEMRTVIKLKAILNGNDGTLASIMAYLNTFFPGTIFLTDNKNMTMDYVVYSTVPLSKELLEIYLPRPMGVGITVTIQNPPTPGGGDPIGTEDGFILGTEDGNSLITETS